VALKFQVLVEGHKELRKAIRDARDKELAKGLRLAHKQTAALVVPPARSLAPVRSGALASTITPSSSLTGAVVRAGSSKGRTKYYAGPIHFGWPKRGISPHPFLFRAAFDRREQYAALFQELLSRLIADKVNTD
jgi:hypothetical protein